MRSIAGPSQPRNTRYIVLKNEYDGDIPEIPHYAGAKKTGRTIEFYTSGVFIKEIVAECSKSFREMGIAHVVCATKEEATIAAYDGYYRKPNTTMITNLPNPYFPEKIKVDWQ